LSLWRRVHGTKEEQSLLADWPIGRLGGNRTGSTG
jgi:hypothetical protein